MALPALEVPLCRVCGGVAHARFAHCFCCATLVRQLQMPLAPVVAMVDYRVGDRMHRQLRGYKDAPVAEVRQACATDLARLVRRWMTANRAGVEDRFGSAWDLVATVPSSARPVGVPVDAVVAWVPDLAARHRRLLGRGPEPIGHLHAARRGFELGPAVDREWLRGRRILVFDDSIITGARSQSAAAALRLAGGRVVGVLAVGRVVAGGRWAARPDLG
jgi:adenine/guanine phosphoribosyltransferase-like PRPP-binding protein